MMGKIVVQLKPDILKLDNPTIALERIESFIRDYVKRAGSDGVVLGMSGGLDSSVVAALCSRALSEKTKILGLCMPEDENYKCSEYGSMPNPLEMGQHLK